MTHHINRIKNKGNVYISLDEEGGVTQSNKSNFLSILNRRSSEKNVSLVDKIFTWEILITLVGASNTKNIKLK